MRALAPSSVWGGSRESLPLSVLSGNADHGMSNNLWAPNQTRPSLSGGLASTERASVYSSHSVAAPVLASERNSYYAGSHKPSIKDNKDKDKDKDSRSIDGRSMHRGDAGDGRSVNFDGKSLYGNESLKGYEGSIRSGALGHGRNDSLPGSNSSPLASPLPVTGSQRGLLSNSRRNSDRLEMEEEAVDERGEWESGEQTEQDHKV